MSSYLLIDSSAYNIYKITSIMKYWKKSTSDHLPIDINNTKFIGKLVELHKRDLYNICKKLNVDLNNILCVRDCPIQNIWRRKIYDKYKENRFTKCNYIIGPIIKLLNKNNEKICKYNIRIDECETDDIIYMLVNLLKSINCNNKIYIITNDSDFYQILIKYPDVSVINPKKMQIIEIKNPTIHLENKIINGDKCDNIPSSKKNNLLLNKQLIDLQYTPRIYQNELVKILLQYNLFSLKIIPSNFRPQNIQLGLCCINTILRSKDPPIFTSRKATLKTVKKNGVKYLQKLAMQNCEDLLKIIEWNSQNGIRVLRISSELFPHITNKKIEKNYTLNFATKILQKIGNLARNYKQRLTFHPSQFNIVAAKDKDIFENTKLDLKYHADVLDCMGCDNDSIIIVHGGGLYGNKQEAIERWIYNFNLLSSNVQKRLVIENCEKCFSITDCLYISDKLNIPTVFDTFHFTCYKQLHPNEEFDLPENYMEKVINTWKKRNIRPKFHVSEQGNGRIGNHSDFVQEIPYYLLSIPEKYNIGIDIMIEAKMKEQAIFNLYKLYPFMDPR